jgi:hypothetical protein
LKYLDTKKDKTGLDDSGLLLDQLVQLCKKHKELETTLDPESKKQGKNQIPDIKHPRLQRLQTHEKIYSLVWRHQNFQKAIKIAQRENGLGISHHPPLKNLFKTFPPKPILHAFHEVS